MQLVLLFHTVSDVAGTERSVLSLIILADMNLSVKQIVLISYILTFGENQTHLHILYVFLIMKSRGTRYDLIISIYMYIVI